MATSRPSKRIRPLSAVCIPATHLISVDLPAPLSPTSAITSPSLTSKSTSWSACTEPKFLETPRSSRVGGFAFTRVFYKRWGAPGGTPHRVDRLLAVLLVLAVAALPPLQEPFLEEELVVRPRDPDPGHHDRLRAADLAVHSGDPLALDDRDRGGRRAARLLPAGLA